MDYGKILLDFRARHNLTQMQLSDVIGVSYEMISKYETGKANPTQKNKIIFNNKMREWENNE